MPDEIPLEPKNTNPVPDKPPRRRRYVKEAEPHHNLIAGAIVVMVAGATGLVVLASGGLTATQGARASTRLKWELRQAEVDQIAAKAEAEGKLRKPGPGH